MKATIHIVVEIPFEIADNGYLGTTNSSIDEHIKAAKEEVQGHHVYLKKNTDKEPKLVKNAKLRVERVVLEV
jgi:hypothetical protein